MSEFRIFRPPITQNYISLQKNEWGTSFPKTWFSRPPLQFLSKMQIFAFLDNRHPKIVHFTPKNTWGPSFPKIWFFRSPYQFQLKMTSFAVLGHRVPKVTFFGPHFHFPAKKVTYPIRNAVQRLVNHRHSVDQRLGIWRILLRQHLHQTRPIGLSLGFIDCLDSGENE